MADKIQFRRDTEARWAQYNPVLLEGEVGYVTDQPNQYKIGDGVRTWNDLPLRGYDGTLVQTTGGDQQAAMSQFINSKLIMDKFIMLQEGAPSIEDNTKHLVFWSSLLDVQVIYHGIDEMLSPEDGGWVYDIAYFNNLSTPVGFEYRMDVIRRKLDGTSSSIETIINPTWDGTGIRKAVFKNIFGGTVDIYVTLDLSRLNATTYFISNSESQSIYRNYSYIQPSLYKNEQQQSGFNYSVGKNIGFIYPMELYKEVTSANQTVYNIYKNLIAGANVLAPKETIDGYNIALSYLNRGVDDQVSGTDYINSIQIIFIPKDDENKAVDAVRSQSITYYNGILGLQTKGICTLSFQTKNPFNGDSIQFILDLNLDAFKQTGSVQLAGIDQVSSNLFNSVRFSKDVLFKINSQGGIQKYLTSYRKSYPFILDSSLDLNDFPSASASASATFSNMCRQVLDAEIYRTEKAVTDDVKVQLLYMNRTTATIEEGIYNNAIQLYVTVGGTFMGMKTYQNELLSLNNAGKGIVPIPFVDNTYGFMVVLYVNLDDTVPYWPIRMNESTYPLYGKMPFYPSCYKVSDPNLNKYVKEGNFQSSAFYGYDVNSGLDYPMIFTDDAPTRSSGLGRYLNLILKNIRCFTHDQEMSNSYELAYINRTTTNAGGWDNTIGLLRRNRENPTETVLQYFRQIAELQNGDTDFEMIWTIDDDIVIFNLDLSKAPVNYSLFFSNYPQGTPEAAFAEKMWLDKKQYSFLGNFQSLGVSNGMSVMNVMVIGETLYVAKKLSRNTDIIFQFQKCMFNELYTFYRVGLKQSSLPYPSADVTSATITWINVSSSDNIGPISINGGGWCGANHSYLEQGNVRTAQNESFALFADGKELLDGDNIFTSKVEVKVINTIFNPTIAPAEGDTILSSPLCTETVVYQIDGNSIKVILSHKFVNSTPVTIANYYGMQSMFSGEDKLLTPNGKYPAWASVVEGGMQFNKQEYPNFRRFVEKNTGVGSYQSTYLLPYQLGEHGDLTNTDFMFSKSSVKAYHHLVGNVNNTRNNGDITNWAGLYSWFNNPIEDSDEVFVYEGRMDGHDLIFIDAQKALTNKKVVLPSKYTLREFIIIQKDDNVTLGETVDVDGITITTTSAASVILKF